MIKIKNLEKIYRTEDVETVALNKLTLEVNEGEFVATTVNRGIDELPLKLRSNIKGYAKDAQVIEIVELQGDTEHAYFVKLRTDGGEKILKGYGNGYLRQTSL